MCPEGLGVTEAVGLDFVLEVGRHSLGEALPLKLSELLYFAKP